MKYSNFVPKKKKGLEHFSQILRDLWYDFYRMCVTAGSVTMVGWPHPGTRSGGGGTTYREPGRGPGTLSSSSG